MLQQPCDNVFWKHRERSGCFGLSGKWEGLGAVRCMWGGAKAKVWWCLQRRKILSFLPMDVKVRTSSKHTARIWSSNLDWLGWLRNISEFQCPHLWNVDTTELPTSQAFGGGQIMRKCLGNYKVLCKRQLFMASLLGNPVGPSSWTVSHKNLTLQDENVPVTSFIYCWWNNS